MKDGGSVFPSKGTYGQTVDGDVLYGACPGLSIRDWFAGQALAGIFADPNSAPDERLVAKACYAVADAMLKAREEFNA